MRFAVPKLACAFSLVVVVGGCHYHRPQSLTSFDRSSLHDDYGHARSLSLSSPVVRLSNGSTGYVAEDQWYAGRNDVGPSVIAGYESARYETSVTYTRDRQSITNGRVYDRYDQTTYRRTVRESTR